MQSPKNVPNKPPAASCRRSQANRPPRSPRRSPSPAKGHQKGWKIVIPGNHPLATPAVVDGKLFIGGGFGSHEFYAFDAKTGKMLWQYRTSR